MGKKLSSFSKSIVYNDYFFFSGLIAVVGVMSSMLLKSKKMIYGITMMMWIVPTFTGEKSDAIIPTTFRICIGYINSNWIKNGNDLHCIHSTCLWKGDHF